MAPERRCSPSRRRLPRVPGLGIVLATALALTSCQAGFVVQADDFDPTALQTYAWRQPPSLAAEQSTPADEAVLKRLELAVNSELSRMGLDRADAATADVLVDARLSVVERLQKNDPVFSLWVAEKWEEGFVAVEFLEQATMRSLWFGEISHRLRYTAHAIGTHAPTFSPTDEERLWQIESIVGRILEPLRAARAQTPTR